MGDGGKGSKPRPFSVSKDVFDNNWDTIFGSKAKLKEETMQVRAKENTEEFGKCGCGRSPTGKCIGWHGLSESEFLERKEKYETGKVDLNGKEIE